MLRSAQYSLRISGWGWRKWGRRKWGRREWGRRDWGRRDWGRRGWGRRGWGGAGGADAGGANAGGAGAGGVGRREMGSGAGVVGRGCPEVDVVDAPRDAVDVDVLGVAGCFGDDHDVVLFRRALVDVSQADHGAGGRRTEETALAAAGFDHRQSSGSSAFLGVAGSAIDARSELGVEWFGHLFRIREVGERCLAAPVECLRAATVVAQ